LDIAICNKAISTRILSESEKQVHLWFEGFLICETTRVTEQQKGAKIYFLPDPSGSKARYSITIRNGEKILKNLLTNIEHGLTQYDSLDSNEKSRFCYIARDILGLNVTGYSVNSIVDLPKGMVDQIEKLKVRLREMPDPL
jgi:hypothetical protein